MKALHLFTVLATIGLTGCGSDNDDGQIPFSDFRQQVKAAGGPSAKDCGQVEVNQSAHETNTCVVDAYSTGLAFYAIYKVQGIDSNVARGLSMANANNVYYWQYDSDIGDGNSRISSFKCESPQLEDVNDDSTLVPIRCMND